LAVEFSLGAIDDLDRLGEDWRTLEARADASFFQSWTWIGTWLRSMPESSRPQVLVGRQDAVIVALALLGRRTTRRHGFVVSHGLYLTETGRNDFDALTVEYNGILADRRLTPEIFSAALAHLADAVPGWDELFLPGVREGVYESPAAAAGLATRVQAHQPCRFVDLAALRSSGVTLLDRLGKNTRYQIRRSKRRYEERGKLDLRLARDASEALSFFDEMKTLHQAAWTARGEPGSFANPFFEIFHRRLIEAAVASGEVQLLRLASGPQTVGVLYNFVFRGRVCNYQSGLAYEDDNAIKPGLVAHEAAIAHYGSAGADAYDFLAGDSQYKRSLGTDAVTLVWLVARKKRLKFSIEELLRSAKGRLRSAPRAEQQDSP
jgi:CelD/BcsL family acetyltransferase involved in cellulose biosynthesis